MLFVFRGTRLLQVILALVTLIMGVSCVLYLSAFQEEQAILSAIIAIVLGGVALVAFSLAVRMPTSFVAISDERTRIRFGGFVDTVILNSDVIGARLVWHPWYAGLGVRSNFGGTVGLIGAWGAVAELDLNQPVRIWLIPRLLRVRARKLRVSVKNPQKLVDRFAASPSGVSGVKHAREVMPASRSKRQKR